MSHQLGELELFLATGKFDTSGDDPITDEDSGEFAGFFDSAAVAKLKRETAPLDRAVAAHYRKLAAAAEQKPAKKLEPAGASAGPGDDVLFNKRSSQERVRASLTAYVRKSLAMGERLQDLCEHARRLDPETALLMQEIGNDILRETA